MSSSIQHGVSPLASTSLLGLRRTSDLLEQHTVVSGSGANNISHTYQQTTRRSSGGDATLADVVRSLTRRDSDDIGASRVSDIDYVSLLEWIRRERMKKLPPEGSSYDKALVWAALFVERVHSFDLGIEQFAGDSHLAAQFSYCYCASLLEVCKIGPVILGPFTKCGAVGRRKRPGSYGPLWFLLSLLSRARQLTRSC